MADLELLELRQIAANLQRLLCLNLSGRDDSAADPAGVAASQSLLLLLETLQRIPITWQLLQQSQVAVCVRACCQVQCSSPAFISMWSAAVLPFNITDVGLGTLPYDVH